MGRWIIVSNRLPFSYDSKRKELKPSSGGLVTAIRGIKSREKTLWVGAIPEEVPISKVKSIKDPNGIKYDGPKISNELYEKYYNGFSNDVLWPMLHYESQRVKYKQDNYDAYKKVNQEFANFLAKTLKDDDVVWVHDFHLFLLPKLLKKKRKNIKIGFFLHVPWPSSETYRQLTPRREILTALLHSDLIGFHDYSYLRHFVNTVYNFLGINSTQMEIRSQYNKTELGVFPVSIDTQDFHKKALSKKTVTEIKKYSLDGEMIKILGVDRLDYTKGIDLKLEAFEQFLIDYPEFIGRVQFIQIAVPSRIDVPEYADLKQKIESKTGEINGRFGTLNYTPVKYIFNSVSTHELMALYRTSQVLFVASKRDGMNLVCLEYIAAQKGIDPGVVLLSEFAGAISTLSHAISINPFNIAATSKRIYQAVSMDQVERLERYEVMYNYLKNYTASNWAESFMSALNMHQVEKIVEVKKIASVDDVKRITKKYKGRPTVLFLDYDGTLSPIVSDPEMANIDQKTYDLVKKLTELPMTQVVIVSGRGEAFLKKQFKGLDCFHAYEHGALFYDFKTKKLRNLISSKKDKWYFKAIEIIRDYSKRTPGSFFEKKTYAITWHYRNATSDYGEFQARKLAMDLQATFAHLPVSVIIGKKVVEIKANEANKGRFAEWFMERYGKHAEFSLAIGDDRTDEDLFEVVNNFGATVKVGEFSKTHAKYYIEEQSKVAPLLKSLF